MFLSVQARPVDRRTHRVARVRYTAADAYPAAPERVVMVPPETSNVVRITCGTVAGSAVVGGGLINSARATR